MADTDTTPMTAENFTGDVHVQAFVTFRFENGNPVAVTVDATDGDFLMEVSNGKRRWRNGEYGGSDIDLADDEIWDDTLADPGSEAWANADRAVTYFTHTP